MIRTQATPVKQVIESQGEIMPKQLWEQLTTTQKRTLHQLITLIVQDWLTNLPNSSTSEEQAK